MTKFVSFHMHHVLKLKKWLTFLISYIKYTQFLSSLEAVFQFSHKSVPYTRNLLLMWELEALLWDYLCFFFWVKHCKPACKSRTVRFHVNPVNWPLTLSILLLRILTDEHDDKNNGNTYTYLREPVEAGRRVHKVHAFSRKQSTIERTRHSCNETLPKIRTLLFLQFVVESW